METAEVVAVSVAALLITIEILCLYLCSKLKCKNYPMCIILPICNEDKEFIERLECLSTHIVEGDPLIGTVLLVDIAGSVQVCSRNNLLRTEARYATDNRLLSRMVRRLWLH